MSPIPLGILAASGAGVAGAYDLLETHIVTTNGQDFTFTNISQEYKHLQLRFTSASSTSSVSDALMRLNGDSASNYVWHELQGNGSLVDSFANTNQTIMRIATQPANTQTNIFAGGVTDILDYTNSSKYTTIRTLAGNTSVDQRIHLYSGLWQNTTAVTSISILGDPQLNARFSLYGIRAA